MKINEIMSYKANLLTRAAECIAYEWPTDFCVDRLNFDFPQFDISKLSPSDKERLYLSKHTLKDGTVINLIPLWMFRIIDPEMEVICIEGTVSKFKDCDLDHRGGYLAYGIY